MTSVYDAIAIFVMVSVTVDNGYQLFNMLQTITCSIFSYIPFCFFIIKYKVSKLIPSY